MQYPLAYFESVNPIGRAVKFISISRSALSSISSTFKTFCMPIEDFPPTEFVPQRLTKEEIENPYKVIYSLFDFAHLPQIREILWDILKTIVSGNWNSLSIEDRSDTLYFFEKLGKLIEAAHIIHQQQKFV